MLLSPVPGGPAFLALRDRKGPSLQKGAGSRKRAQAGVYGWVNIPIWTVAKSDPMEPLLIVMSLLTIEVYRRRGCEATIFT